VKWWSRKRKSRQAKNIWLTKGGKPLRKRPCGGLKEKIDPQEPIPTGGGPPLRMVRGGKVTKKKKKGYHTFYEEKLKALSFSGTY